MKKIAFLHPDMGIGGAERLVVDAALALKKSGNSITIFTSHHDRNHCFPETKEELKVIVAGDWIPRSLFGRCAAIFAYLRMIYLTIHFLYYYSNKYDLTICDIIPVSLPLLRWYGKKSIFYGHFPDQLLTKKETILKKLYRLPIDWLEGFTLSYADITLVNSCFTQQMFEKTFPSKNFATRVLYPTVNFASFDKKINGNLQLEKIGKVDTLFLSINRYERKKNLNLAIESLRELYNVNNCNDERSRSRVHLIMAGGYDPLNVENIEHYQELVELARDLGIENNVTFLKSPSDDEKQLLLHSCTAVIYTPENEHFGIVPLEAMYMNRPVIATNSGGPKETVIDGETGFLCQSNVVSFADAMNKFVKDKSLSREMGRVGHDRVVSKFNFKTFQAQLSEVIQLLFENK